jgi:hypothetical protein
MFENDGGGWGTNRRSPLWRLQFAEGYGEASVASQNPKIRAAGRFEKTIVFSNPILSGQRIYVLGPATITLPGYDRTTLR